ncbi:hypothetical protein ACWDX9_46425, partial [Nonomuraea sp. NPDC003201]
ALRAAVAALAADPDRRARMSRQARESVRGRDWASVCEELVGHYHGVMTGEPASPGPAGFRRRAAVGSPNARSR